ncbi:MAG: hypothetical protein PWR03_549, partial [Tenuifilum sp.]|uniref:hypothetical protein n=1 Tax=Tenuifilum sp. TaxID=2760880 RepID=UPI0024ABE689
MKRTFITAIFAFSIILFNSGLACTTAIISGKVTPDGRPLLWKHRDADNFNNKVVYEVGPRFKYLALINSDDPERHVWAGTNSAGFSIMNSASYNIKPDTDSTIKQDLEGLIMKLALGSCATITDFAQMLDTLPKPWGVSANFGIIDAKGGAGYFEVNNFSYRFYDANSNTDAPDGFLVRTNFSVSGESNKGAGYIRFATATNLLKEAKAAGDLTPEFLLTNATVSLKQEFTNIDLTKEISKVDKIVSLRDYILRYYSSSTVVIQGVLALEPTDFSTMWVKLGFQPASVAVPLWVGAGGVLPQLITAPGTQNAKLCDYTLQLKKSCFPLENWDEGKNYVLLNSLVNNEQTGLIQLTRVFDREIIQRTQMKYEKWRKF